MRTILCSLILLVTGAPNLWGQAESLEMRPTTARDLEPPLQDLETMEGEIVWLQAVLLRGDPTPYRDPRIPLAAYEQGLLDEEGKMWTILDTPKGRELRYNPNLRGQRVEVKGWLYAESRIVNVHSWGDSQSHPVRLVEGYPEPKRIPFDPSKAEPIETIKPAAPETIQPDLLDNSLWKIQEGTDLGVIENGAAPIQVPEADTSGRFQEILQEEGLLKTQSDKATMDKSASNGMPSDGNVVAATAVTVEATPTLSVPTPVSPPAPSTPPSRILNDEGEPLARPEEFDDALQKSLFE